jgi:hypothetical protein
MGMDVAVSVLVAMGAFLFMLMSMPVFMGMLMGMHVSGVMIMLQMNIKLHAVDAVLLLPAGVEVVTVNFQLRQFALQPPGVHPQVNQRPQKHVAADAAEDIEIKSFHAVANRLIWLAA